MRTVRAAAAQSPSSAPSPPSPAAAADRHRRRAATTSPKTLTYWASNQGPSIEVDKKILTPGAGEVREADRHQGQAGGRPLVRPAQPDPRRHHVGSGPRRAEHRQHLVRLAPGHRRAAAVGPARTSTRSAARTASSTRRVALGRRRGPGPGRRAAVLAGVRALLQQEDVRRGRHHRSRRPPGTSWSPTARRSPRTASGASAPRAATSRTTSTRSSSSASSTAPTSSTAAGKPTFTSDGAVAAVKQYVDLMAKDKIIAPGNAEYAQNQSLSDFAKGKTAMVLWQAAATTFAVAGHEARRLGRRPRARRSPAPRAAASRSTRWSPASTWRSSRTPRTSTAPRSS